jgi:hypothetical protein
MLLMGRQSSFTGTLTRKPRLLGGDEEAGIKKIKINYRDATRFARGIRIQCLTLFSFRVCKEGMVEVQ